MRLFGSSLLLTLSNEDSDVTSSSQCWVNIRKACDGTWRCHSDQPLFVKTRTTFPHACSPGAQEPKAGGSKIQGQPGLYRETLSQNSKKPNNPKNKQIFKTCFSNYVWVFGQTRPTCMCMINNLNLDNTCGHFTSWSENYHFIKIHLKLVRSRQRYYLRLNNELWNTVSFLKTCYPFCKLNYLAILTF